MSSYFKPLRRKIGVLTLLIACMFAGGWVRSRAQLDYIGIRPVEWVYSCSSFRNALHIDCSRPNLDPPLISWESTDLTEFDARTWREIWFVPVGARGHWFGSPVIYNHRNKFYSTISRVSAPYWSIVLPLIAISAWLLLSKPRAKIEPLIVENGKP